jgi:catechol 2,3-dioxygenase-like lactoylglutathione lyase family enzyme
LPTTNRGIEFNHVIIYVRDVARSLAFYRDLLGFKLLEKYDSDEYARLQSPTGKSTIALHKASPTAKTPGNKEQSIVLYFETRNLDSLCKNLARKGVSFLQMPKLMPWGWRHAYLKDPDGRELSLYWAGRKRFEGTKS